MGPNDKFSARLIRIFGSVVFLWCGIFDLLLVMSLRHYSPIPLVFPLWCQFRATMWGEGDVIWEHGLVPTHRIGYPLVRSSLI